MCDQGLVLFIFVAGKLASFAKTGLQIYQIDAGLCHPRQKSPKCI
jgi:hypothetical protein